MSDRAGGGDRADGAEGAIAAFTWPRWTCEMRVVVADAAALARAHEIVEAVLDDVELAASRFRGDSEIAGLARAGGRATRVSPTLTAIMAAALGAAEATRGLVDPTLGNAMVALGYAGTPDPASHWPSTTGRWGAAGPRGPAPGLRADASNGPVRVARRTSYRDVHLDQASAMLTVPDRLLLDLGATAKAWAADEAAARVAADTGTGVLVSLGGDIATAGPPPDGGWRIRVAERAGVTQQMGSEGGLGAVRQDVGSGGPAAEIILPAGGALATSGTGRRRWYVGDDERHHLIDPVTRRPADPLWATVSVAAPSCVEANTWSTAAVVAGPAAPRLVRDRGLAARLVGVDGHIRWVGGWPAAAELPVAAA